MWRSPVTTQLVCEKSQHKLSIYFHNSHKIESAFMHQHLIRKCKNSGNKATCLCNLFKQIVKNIRDVFFIIFTFHLTSIRFQGLFYSLLNISKSCNIISFEIGWMSLHLSTRTQFSKLYTLPIIKELQGKSWSNYKNNYCFLFVKCKINKWEWFNRLSGFEKIPPPTHSSIRYRNVDLYINKIQ